MSARWLQLSPRALAPLLCGLLITQGAGAAAEQDRTAHEKGRDIYNFRCYFCHGYSGNSRTLAATYLQPKPVDFTRLSPSATSVESFVSVLKLGRPGTAMKSFLGILSESDLQLVAGFVMREFVEGHASNTRYHTLENGWPAHDRYKVAFPFITGEIPVSRPWESLSPEQSLGKRLYLASCVTCHDRGVTNEDVNDDQGVTFEREKGVQPRRGAAGYGTKPLK